MKNSCRIGFAPAGFSGKGILHLVWLRGRKNLSAGATLLVVHAGEVSGGFGVAQSRRNSLWRDGVVAVGQKGGVAHCGSIRPFNFHPVGFSGSTQTEDLARVVRGEIAATAGLEAGTRDTSCGPADSRSDAVAAASGAYKGKARPVSPFVCLVVQQHTGSGVVGDKDVELAVIVEISHCQAPCGKAFGQGWSGFGGHVACLRWGPLRRRRVG